MVKNLLQFKVASHGLNPSQLSILPHTAPQSGANLLSSPLVFVYPVDVNAKMADGNTVLHLAIEASNEDMVRILLSQPNVLANERNRLCYTPLLKAKEMANESAVRILLPHAINLTESTAAARACDLSEAAITDFYTSDITAGFAETNHFSVRDVLYGVVTEKEKVRTVQPQISIEPSQKRFMKFEFQWVDLPSNNAAWAEILLIKWCLWKSSSKARINSEPETPASNVKLYTESLSTLFETQNVLKIHSRQLKPDCSMKLDTTNICQLFGRLYMPYLRWQTDEKQQELQTAIERASQSDTIYDVCNMSCDDALLRGYDMHDSTQLHLRRTLDQYRYPAMSTKERDRDQVVYRYYRYRYREVGNARWKKPRIYMVDQLWLWAVPEAIITCMPEIGDGRGVHEEVIYDMNILGDQVSDQIDFIAVVLTRCLGLFDRHYPDNRELRFFEHFEWSLGDITEKATKLLTNFERDVAKVTKWLDQRISANHSNNSIPVEEDYDIDDANKLLFVNRLINIADETKLHFECLDMNDELVSLSMVLTQQIEVVDKFWTAFQLRIELDQLSESQKAQRARHYEILQHDQAEISRLRRSIVDVESILSELLNMKPRYATAIEARFTRDQAEGTARQSQILMVFTIVTIVFLPLSFLATFFAINISAFPRDTNDQLNLGWVSKYLFGIGIGVSVPLVVVAFAFGEMRIWKEQMSSMLSRKKEMKQQTTPQDVPKLPMTGTTLNAASVSRLGQISTNFQQRTTRKSFEEDEESGGT